MPRALLAAALAAAALSCTKSPPAPAPSDGARTNAVDPSPTKPPPSDVRAQVHFSTAGGDVVVRAEVVQSPATVQRGLMYRTHLPPEEGMLFLLGYEDDHSFWMHNTLIPLDMIFIGKDMKVVGVVADAEPRTDTHRQVGKPSLYVLEVNAGWAAAHHVAAGTTARFEGTEEAAH
jgi:uncharacterized protein